MKKYPKHRTTIYTIVRERWDDVDQSSSFTILDSFRSSERAEEVVEAYRKEVKDKGIGYNLFFDVMASTYYDE